MDQPQVHAKGSCIKMPITVNAMTVLNMSLRVPPRQRSKMHRNKICHPNDHQCSIPTIHRTITKHITDTTNKIITTTITELDTGFEGSPEQSQQPRQNQSPKYQKRGRLLIRHFDNSGKKTFHLLQHSLASPPHPKFTRNHYKEANKSRAM